MIDALIAFAGTAELSWKATAALLDDHFDGYDNEVQIEAILPLTHAAEGPTQEIYHKVLAAVGIPWNLVQASGFDRKEMSRASRMMIREALDAPDLVDDVAHEIVKRLVAVEQAGGDAVLIVALGETPDEWTMTLLEEAVDNQVLVLDITHGLDDVNLKEPEEEPEHKPPLTRARPPKSPVVPAEEHIAEAAQDDSTFVSRVTELLRGAAAACRTELERANSVYRALNTLFPHEDAYAAAETAALEALDLITVIEETVLTHPEFLDHLLAEPKPDAEDDRNLREHGEAEEEIAKPVGRPRRKKPVTEEVDEVPVLRLANGSYRELNRRGRRPAGSEVVNISRAHFAELEFSS